MANPNQNPQHQDNPANKPGQQQQGNPRPISRAAGRSPDSSSNRIRRIRTVATNRAAALSADRRFHTFCEDPARTAGFSRLGSWVRGATRIFRSLRLPYAGAMPSATALPLFHLYGDPPDDQAFDFIHVETIASRSSVHDWTIRAHRHRNLFQILLIERGGGEMTLRGREPCRSRRRPQSWSRRPPRTASASAPTRPTASW